MFAHAILTFIVNAAWQDTLIVIVALTLVRGRHLTMALLLCLMAPLIPAPVERSAAIAAHPLSPTLANAVAVAYVVGFVIAAAGLVVRFARAFRIVATSRALDDHLRVSDLIDAPVTIGRTIYVPASVGRDEVLLRAARAHEEAHVRHNDYFVHLIVECLALPLHFHPAVHLLRKRIAEEREVACDREAAAQLGRTEYVDALLAIASHAIARDVAAIAMASPPALERRVRLLLARTSARPPRVIHLALLTMLAFACTRFHATPVVERALLRGTWRLDNAASDFRSLRPTRYDSFTQTIEQTSARVTVHQRRVVNGNSQAIQWSVVTDGREREVGGMPEKSGTARWQNGSLALALHGPGAHTETAVAFIRGDRLVCEGNSDGKSYHAEFERINR